jgi:hypothetical protein
MPAGPRGGVSWSEHGERAAQPLGGAQGVARRLRGNVADAGYTIGLSEHNNGK